MNAISGALSPLKDLSSNTKETSKFTIKKYNGDSSILFVKGRVDPKTISNGYDITKFHLYIELLIILSSNTSMSFIQQIPLCVGIDSRQYFNICFPINDNYSEKEYKIMAYVDDQDRSRNDKITVNIETLTVVLFGY